MDNSLSLSVEQTASRLLEYCRRNDWAGYDPYDALNSRLFLNTPLNKSKWCRIVFTQVMKRLPINLRPILAIPREQNPKAIALFLMVFLKQLEFLGSDRDRLVKTMVERLQALRSPNMRYYCWGYSFPWQGRVVFAPKWEPNLVCTVFVAQALLSVYESGAGEHCLEMAISAAQYILNELYWTEGDEIASISYPNPGLKTRVHNANLLGAALFSRVFRHNGESRFQDAAVRVTRYSTGRQHEDGSWDYGEHPKQQWVDNFHTGYNLCALRNIGQSLETTEFNHSLRRGHEYYIRNFFTEQGAPKYYNNRVYPIDIHSVAQSIITLIKLRDLDDKNVALAQSVISWAIKHLWVDKGYFSYQAHPLYVNRVPYMRWSQAWMLLALATILESSDSKDVAGTGQEVSQSGRHDGR